MMVEQELSLQGGGGVSDTEYPQFTGLWDDNSTIIGEGDAHFNATILSCNGTAWVTINGTEYPATNITGNDEYSVTIGLGNGTYDYNWSAYGNGTDHLFNTTEPFRSYTIKNSVFSDIIVAIALNTPPDGNVSRNGISFFNATYNVYNGSMTNATLYLYDGTMAVYKSNFTTLGGINHSYLSLSEIAEGMYNWTYYACANNATGSKCFIGSNVSIQFTSTAMGGSVTLISPADNNLSITPANFFNATFITSNSSTTNATLYLYNAAGVYKSNYTVLNGLNRSYLSLSSLNDDWYNWTYELCINNATSSLCTVAANRSLHFVNVIENSEIYNARTTEGNVESFSINVTTISNAVLTIGKLYYNGVAYTGTLTSIGGSEYILNRTIQIPQVSAGSNLSFYWNMIFDTGLVYNSTLHNQTVDNLNIDNCSYLNYSMINYYLKDEGTKATIDGILYNTSIYADVTVYADGYSTPVINYSIGKSNTNNLSICLNNQLNNSRYTLYSTARYFGDSYASEFHNIQNYTLKNNTLDYNITLYDLKSSDSTQFTITFKDTSFLPVENALIDITRYYVNDGMFRSVEIPKTDSNGQTLGHFDTDNVVYTLIISKYGKVLSTFANIIPVCEDVVIGNCKINLDSTSTGDEFQDWNDAHDINYIFSFNETLRKVSLIFTTSDGSSAAVYLNTTKFDRFGTTVVCSDSITTSSGTLTCTVPDVYGNLTIVSELFKDGSFIDRRIYSIMPDPEDVFGATGILLALILMITIPFLFIGDKIGMIIGIFFGIIISVALMLVNNGSWLGTTSVILWFIVAGGILIWKISRTDTY